MIRRVRTQEVEPDVRSDLRGGLLLFILWVIAAALVLGVFAAVWFSIQLIAQPLYWAAQNQMSAGLFYFCALVMVLLWPIGVFALVFLARAIFGYAAGKLREDPRYPRGAR